VSRKDARLEVAGAASAGRALPKAGEKLHEPGGRVMQTVFGVMFLVVCVSSSCLPLSVGALGLGLALLAQR
jgi:hypothetical protein